MDAMEMSTHRSHATPMAAGDQGAPDVSPLPEGGFVLVFEDREGEHVHGIRFLPDGSPQPVAPDAPGQFVFRLNPDGPPVGRTLWAPKVSALADGGFLAVYNSEDWDAPAQRGVRGRLFLNDGTSGPEFAVGHHPRRWQDPDVAVLGDQTAVVSWQALGPSEDNLDWLVWVQPIRSDGAPLMAAFPVGADRDFSRRRGHLAFRGHGGWAAAWEARGQDGDGLGAYARLVAPFTQAQGRLAIERLSESSPAEVRVRFTGEPLECYEMQSTQNFEVWNAVFRTNSVNGQFQYETDITPGPTPRAFRVERIFSP